MLYRVFLIILFFASCVKDVDFEQAENLTISPVLESSLIYFNFPATRFVDSQGNQNVVERDTVNLDIFNESFAQDNLTKAEFFFEITNSIDRNFQSFVEFFDASDQQVHGFTIDVVPDGNNEVITTHTETFEDTTLEALKNTVKVAVTLTMFPDASGVPLNQNSPGTIRMRSKATLYLTIDTQ